MQIAILINKKKKEELEQGNIGDKEKLLSELMPFKFSNEAFS